MSKVKLDQLEVVTDISALATGVSNNDILATQGYVDDSVSVENLWDRVTGGTNYLVPHTGADELGATGARISKVYLNYLDIADAADGDITTLLLKNSQANSASSLNETVQARFGFGSDDEVAKIVVGKIGDYTSGPNSNSFMDFYVDNDGSPFKIMTLQGEKAIGAIIDINVTTTGIFQPILNVTGNTNGVVGNFSSSNTDGIAGNFVNSFNGHNSRVLRAEGRGSGDVFLSYATTSHTGTNAYIFYDSNASTGINAKIEGAHLGKGLQILTTNAANTSATIEAIQSGPGPVAVFTGGNVMIGAGTPTEKLEVQGNILSSLAGSDGYYSLDNASSVETVKLDTNGSSFLNGGDFGIGTNTPVRKVHIFELSSTFDDLVPLFRTTLETTGSPTPGLGITHEFEVESADSGNLIIGSINSYYTDTGLGTETSEMTLDIIYLGSPLNVLTLQPNKLVVNGNLSIDEVINLTPKNAAGATPIDSDVSTWSNNDMGLVKGTGGRIFLTFKNSTDVYYVELSAI